MLSLQRSTAALTGILLLAASLSVGVHPAAAQSAQPAPAATQEAGQTHPTTTAPAETASNEVAHTEAAPADLSDLFPGGIPSYPDHTYEGGTSLDGHGHDLNTHALEGAAMSPLGAGGTLARRGDIKVRLVTVDLADSTALVPAAAARTAIAKSSEYWKSMSNGRLTMTVATESLNFKSAAKSTDSYDQIMNKVTAEQKWSYSPYTALVVFIPTPLKEGYLGYGWSSSGTSGRILMPYTSSLSNFTTNVVTHEFGHVLGLMHADSLQCTSGRPDTASFGTDCSIRHYGDTSDLMGISRWFDTPAISSSFWDYGAFGRGDEILNVGVASGSKTYTLRPWAGTSANRALKFTDPKSGEIYYLELRVPVGFDANTATAGNRGVKVVQSGGLTPASSVLLMPSSKPYTGYYATNTAWQAGSVFTTHAGTTVRINSVSDTAASVTITATTPAAVNPAPSPAPAPAPAPAPVVASAGRTDMNRDGNPDIVARDSTGKLWLYPTTSAGGFNGRVQIGSGWGGMNMILQPGDFSGDGIADILGRDSTGRLWLYAGTGTGGVKSGVQIGNGWGGMTALVTPGDFDGDGYPDLLARGSDGRLYLYSGNGKGGWRSQAQIGSGWGGMTAMLSTGDFNGDGKSDLLARDSSGGLHLYPGNGRGGFLAKSQPGAGWNGMTAFAGPGPWGADSNADLIARNSSGDLLLYTGSGTGRFTGSQKIGQGWNGMYIVE
ncbi:FG-GAP-like repeat-containing protein [Arthrobacter sp.]|uniref:FG-GAP-like repeat-containing protein n=1 Tax=Arthrobacter sp. TaxID=1667 RepID=UPI002811C955|nr:FG-GAP-like repeat-containing protein [Arthrobacter sp.]